MDNVRKDIPAHVWVALAEHLSAIWSEAYDLGVAQGRAEQRRHQPIGVMITCGRTDCPMTET